MTTAPASTKIATCYNPTNAPGSGRCIEIRKFSGFDDPYVIAEIHNGAAVYSRRCPTEERAIAIAANLGYDEVLRASADGTVVITDAGNSKEVPHASGSLHVDGEMTDTADYET